MKEFDKKKFKKEVMEELEKEFDNLEVREEARKIGREIISDLEDNMAEIVKETQ